MNRPEVHDVIRHLRRVTAEFPGRVLVGEAYLPVEELAALPRQRRRPGVRPRLRLRAAAVALGASGAGAGYRAFGGAPSAGVVADLRDQQPRPAASRHPLGSGADAGGGVPAPHPARRRRALRRRGDRDGRRRPLGPARSAVRPRRPRRRPHADAVGRDRRWAGSRPAARGCRSSIRRPATSPTSPPIPESLLSLYRRLIAARRDVPALGRGSHRSIFGVAPEVLAWVRELDGERVLVLLNVGDRAASLRGHRPRRRVARSWSGPIRRAAGRIGLDGLTLAPLEGLALRL